MKDGLLLLGLIVIGTALVAVLRYRAKRRIARRHAAIELTEIHRLVAGSVSRETLQQVFIALGAAYSIDPRVIRPQDPLKALLDMDSWSLDGGTEKMNKWLQSVGVNGNAAPSSTVLDLLMLVEQSSPTEKPPVISLGR